MTIKINGKDVNVAFPIMTEEDLNKPLKKVAADPIIDPESITQHEQIYRAIEMFLVEQGFDAICYGTGGTDFPSEPDYKPAIVVMIGCDKFEVTLDNYDIVVFKRSLRPYTVAGRSYGKVFFSALLQEPDSLDQLVEFLRTLP
jgi:hypothetical protein